MWKCLHCDLWALCTHVTGLLHSSSPRSSSEQNHLLSTRWGYKSHCKNCNEHFVPTFPGLHISRYGDIKWPARSPYLSVCDFYLWGHLKSVVYSAPPPHTTQELKLQVQEEISRIPVDVLRRAMSSVHDRLAECEQCNRGQLEDVIFRVEWCVMFFFMFCVMFQDHWFTISTNAKVCTSL